MTEGNGEIFNGIPEMSDSPLKNALLNAAKSGHKLLKEAGHPTDTAAEVYVKVPSSSGRSEKFKTTGKLLTGNFGG
ncbi:MAG: hypothetical protein Q8P53_00640 [Candidatus Shapirobacteria bacterium]|nr:hypothetical protein [Candidatus Shapirobacteria bacterium]